MLEFRLPDLSFILPLMAVVGLGGAEKPVRTDPLAEAPPVEANLKAIENAPKSLSVAIASLRDIAAVARADQIQRPTATLQRLLKAGELMKPIRGEFADTGTDLLPLVVDEDPFAGAYAAAALLHMLPGCVSDDYDKADTVLDMMAVGVQRAHRRNPTDAVAIVEQLQDGPPIPDKALNARFEEMVDFFRQSFGMPLRASVSKSPKDGSLAYV